MPTSGAFNHEMLRLARESRGVTQADLAENLAISQGLLSKIENGVVVPLDDLIAKMAHTLRYPREFFTQADRMYTPPTWFHRKRQRLAGRTLDQVHALVNLALMHLRRLLRSVEVDEGPGIPRIDVDVLGSPEDVARALRDAWHIPAGPIPSLTRVIEDAGGIIFPVDFGLADIDGMVMQVPRLPPVFFLHANLPTDRLRFTLAHELGHLVMHWIPNEEMEDQANRFAAEFLMPAADIRHQLQRVNLSHLAALKPVWRVSMGALLKRAGTLGTIPHSTYQHWWRKMGEAGYKMREPSELDLSPEAPTVLPDIIRAHIEDLGYGLRELRKALHIADEADFQRFYPAMDRRMRLMA